MPATNISVVETALGGLYRKITITPQQSQRMREELRHEHAGVSEQHTESLPKLNSVGLTAKRQKILDAYYRDAISLQLLQSELERIVTQMGAEFLVLPNDLSKGLERITLREDAYSNFERATFEQRRVMNRTLFGAINVFRSSSGAITLESVDLY